MSTFMNYHMKQNCTNDTISYLWRNNNNKKNQVLCHDDAGCHALTKVKCDSTKHVSENSHEIQSLM